MDKVSFEDLIYEKGIFAPLVVGVVERLGQYLSNIVENEY